ncbi:MAG: LytTR family DNA-binding domain-containing protein [Chitinophagaceae bacterium]|jgi:two-component system LytT family response regulator|nr:LytTR family DNA-binding domain-containing protein [Chitinophagaceae bacterium]
MIKPLKAVLVDDEAGSVAALDQLLQTYCPQLQVVGSAANPIEAKEVIEREVPDLVFLDIEMPYGNAFDLLDSIGEIKFEVIFVTAYNNYAIKAFRYAAADYLLKPISIDELVAAVDRVEKRRGHQEINNRVLSVLASVSGGADAFKKIILPTLEGFLVEDVSKIMYLHAEGSYTYFYMADRRKLLVSKNLKEFEDMLPEPTFCRIHHSSIININFVKKYYKGRGGEVEMEDGETILISTRKKSEFFSRFR